MTESVSVGWSESDAVGDARESDCVVESVRTCDGDPDGESPVSVSVTVLLLLHECVLLKLCSVMLSDGVSVIDKESRQR